MYISSRQYLHVCTCRISSRPSIAVLTSSIGDSAVGSLSETSRGPEHTRERLATYTEEKKSHHALKWTKLHAFMRVKVRQRVHLCVPAQ